MTVHRSIPYRMFVAYNQAGRKRWQSFDGRPVPHWHSVGPDVQEKWQAAAEVFNCLHEDVCAEFHPITVTIGEEGHQIQGLTWGERLRIIWYVLTRGAFTIVWRLP